VEPAQARLVSPGRSPCPKGLEHCVGDRHAFVGSAEEIFDIVA
jgi:hypothetical protein